MGLAALKIEDLPHYTYDDYVQWEGQWELINGIPHALVPMFLHCGRINIKEVKILEMGRWSLI